MGPVTPEVIALNNAMTQLVRLEGVLASMERVEKVPQHYAAAINNAKAFLSQKKLWVQQAQEEVFKLGPSVVVSANRISTEAGIAASMIESYLKKPSV